MALRKCLALVETGAAITVIAPEIAGGLQDLSAAGRISHEARRYRPGDLNGAFVVFAATDNAETNAAVSEEARAVGLLVNRADFPDAGDFISPAFIARGELVISVSTGGRSPALSGRIRDDLEKAVGEEYAETLHLLAAVRQKLLTEKRERQYNKKLLNLLVSHDLPKLYRENALEAIDTILSDIFGPGYSLNELVEGKKDPHEPSSL